MTSIITNIAFFIWYNLNIKIVLGTLKILSLITDILCLFNWGSVKLSTSILAMLKTTCDKNYHHFHLNRWWEERTVKFYSLIFTDTSLFTKSFLTHFFLSTLFLLFSLFTSFFQPVSSKFPLFLYFVIAGSEDTTVNVF